MKNKVYVLMGQVDYENTDCLGVYSSKEDAAVAINQYMRAAQKDWDSNTYNLCRYDRYFIEERYLNVPAEQVEPVCLKFLLNSLILNV